MAVSDAFRAVAGGISTGGLPPPGGAGGIVPPGVASGGVKGLLGGVKGSLGGAGGVLNKWGPAALVAYALSQYAGQGGQRAEQDLEIEALGRRTEAINPEDMMFQAMLQSSQQDEQFARNQLVNQLMGVTGPSKLARGEERI